MIAGLPYDAEVEWLQSKSDGYIDTGMAVSDKTEVEFWFNADQYANTYIPIFGVYQSDGYLGCQISYGGSPSLINAWRGTSTKSNIVETRSLDQCSGVIELKNGQWGINGTFKSFPSSAFQSTSTAWYNRVNGINKYGAVRKFGYLKMWEDGVLVFDGIPVRFTNSNGQSEGAMYDRVSRKLFRNAGTGSFTIGPDVATPVMGLHFFKSQIKTAKDYVQNGLIAMWDGIENVGYGQHDDNATSWLDLTGGGANWLLKDSHTPELFEVGSDYVKILSEISYNGRGYCSPSWTSADDLITCEIVFDADNVDMTTVTNARRVVGFINSGTGVRSIWMQSGYVNCGYKQYPCATIPQGTNSMSFDFGVQRALMNGTFFDSQRKGLGWIYCLGPSLSGYGYGDAYCAVGAKIKALRVYGRSLSDAERLANYAIDKARFNLP